jgi:hypothetical protein
MCIKTLIDNINKICNNEKINFDIYIKTKDLLDNMNYDEFIKELKNYTFENIVEIKNSESYYTKYIIKSDELFDLIYIKWNEKSFTKIHDHPNKGCIFKILSGCLIEECYDNNEKYISFENINFLSKNMVSYKISKKKLHKIIASSDTESLHIYIPGKYSPNNY